MEEQNFVAGFNCSGVVNLTCLACNLQHVIHEGVLEQKDVHIESAIMTDKQVIIRLDKNYTECHEACSAGSDNRIKRYTNMIEMNYTSMDLMWVDGNRDTLESVNTYTSNHRVLQNLVWSWTGCQ